MREDYSQPSQVPRSQVGPLRGEREQVSDPESWCILGQHFRAPVESVRNPQSHLSTAGQVRHWVKGSVP